MKINKLKVFFISCFITLLVSLTAKATPVIDASAISTQQEIFAPKNSPSEYNFEKYNHCGTAENDIFLCAFNAKYTCVIYSNNTSTYVAFFDDELYKVKEINILQHGCIAGIILDKNIYLINNQQLFIFNLNFNLEQTLLFNDLTDIQILDNKIYLFCNGDLSLSVFDFGYIITSPYSFCKKDNDYFIFQNSNEILITDFANQLIFEIDNILSAKSSGDSIVFATQQNGEIIITYIKNFEITYTTILKQDANYVDFIFEENGLLAFLTEDKTYKYFICNHGDIILSEVYSDIKYISVSNNIYENNSYIFITTNNIKYQIVSKIYNKNYVIIKNIIIFDLYDNLETYGAKDIYVAILKQ